MKNQERSILCSLCRVILVRLPHLLSVLAVIIASVQFDISLFVPVLFTMSLWLVVYGLKAKIDRSALEFSLENKFGHSQLKPNQWVAICGKVQQSNYTSTRKAKTILAYYYRIFDTESRFTSRKGQHSRKYSVRRFDGFYQTPMRISTPSGMVKLVGFPDLLHLKTSSFPDNILSHGEAIAKIVPSYIPSFLARALVVDQARNEIDMVIKYGGRESVGSGSAEFRSLFQGNQICVFGRWNNGELLPSSFRPRGLPVYAGPAENVLEEIKGDGNAFLVMGIVFSAFTFALVLWSLF